MDYRDLLQEHVRSGAEITLGTTPVNREAALSFGIMQSDAKRRIFRFEEKPKDPKLLDELRIPPDLLNGLGRPADAELYQGSMGIYVFNRQTLIDALDNPLRRLRQAHNPSLAEEVQGLCLYLPGILGRHWNGSGLFRSAPGPDGYGSSLQLL